MGAKGKEQLLIKVTENHRQMLDQEVRRLKDQYGITLTKAEVVQLLIEIHRLKLQTMATETSDAQWWMYQSMVDNE